MYFEVVHLLYKMVYCIQTLIHWYAHHSSAFVDMGTMITLAVTSYGLKRNYTSFALGCLIYRDPQYIYNLAARV